MSTKTKDSLPLIPSKTKDSLPLMRPAASPAFAASLVNQDSLSVTSPKRTRKRRPLTESDPLVSKSISMRSSFYLRLQELADSQQETVPGGANLSLYVRKVLERHVSESSI